VKLQRAISTATRAIRRTVGVVLRRIFDDAEDARYRDMERDIRSLIDQSDGHLSDEIERRIARRLMRNSGFLAECHRSRQYARFKEIMCRIAGAQRQGTRNTPRQVP
jgi:hypothetical protein